MEIKVFWTETALNNLEDNYIKIATVFDCRQNPEKLKKV